jgi:hypothetical protein
MSSLVTGRFVFIGDVDQYDEDDQNIVTCRLLSMMEQPLPEPEERRKDKRPCGREVGRC